MRKLNKTNMRISIGILNIYDHLVWSLGTQLLKYYFVFSYSKLCSFFEQIAAPPKKNTWIYVYKVIFYFIPVVNHHQSTIWQNMFLELFPSILKQIQEKTGVGKPIFINPVAVGTEKQVQFD